jgi:hypothetical protein
VDHLYEDESTRMIWAIYHASVEERVGHILAEVRMLLRRQRGQKSIFTPHPI